jgi:hypothetical protein
MYTKPFEARRDEAGGCSAVRQLDVEDEPRRPELDRRALLDQDDLAVCRVDVGGHGSSLLPSPER